MLLAGSIKDIDTGSSAGVPGAVWVSSQDTVIAGQIPATEGCRWLDYTQVWTSVQGSSLWKHNVVNVNISKKEVCKLSHKNNTYWWLWNRFKSHKDKPLTTHVYKSFEKNKISNMSVCTSWSLWLSTPDNHKHTVQWRQTSSDLENCWSYHLCGNFPLRSPEWAH